MSDSSRRSFLVVLVALMCSALACSLAIGEDAGSDSSERDPTGVPLVDASSVTLAPLPEGQAVAVISHTDGQQVYNNQFVDLTVQSSTTTTQFVLKVSGSTVGIKPMPPGQSGATQAILSWMPRREGTYSIQVLAYNGSTLNGSTTLNLVVSGSAPAEGGQPSSGGACTGTVLVLELNFRDGPGTAAKRLGQFNISETLTVIGHNNDSSWYKVRRADGQEVWAINNTNWLRIEGECSALPVAQ